MKLALKSSLLALVCVSGAAMAGNFSGPEAGASVTMNGGSTTIKQGSFDFAWGGVFLRIQIARRLWI